MAVQDHLLPWLPWHPKGVVNPEVAAWQRLFNTAARRLAEGQAPMAPPNLRGSFQLVLPVNLLMFWD